MKTWIIKTIFGTEFAELKRNATENFVLIKNVLGVVVESGAKSVAPAVIKHYSM